MEYYLPTKSTNFSKLISDTYLFRRPKINLKQLKQSMLTKNKGWEEFVPTFVN